MISILINIKSLLFRSSALACGLAGFLMFLQSGYAAGTASDPTCLDAGFHEMYNLDFAAAHKTFEQWQEIHPEDPLGAAANAAAYLFGEFERLHILQLDLFTEKKKLSDQLTPDPNVKSAFQSELAKADSLANKILAESPDDINALFSRTLTDGLRGNYAALIEKQQKSGLDFLKSSRVTAEKLIALDPTYSDAYLAIGIENYLLGMRSAPTRWVLRLTGAQTNKDKGIASLKITAEKGRYLGPYARLLLAIAALRDRDQKTAKKLLTELAGEFPQNRLYQVELGRLQS
jgi:hypothetical protein